MQQHFGPLMNSRLILRLLLALCIGALLPVFLTAQAGPDQLVCPGGSVRIGQSGFNYGDKSPSCFKWMPEEGLSNATDAEPDASPAETTEYEIIVSFDDGSVLRDRVLVQVREMLIDPNPALLCSGKNTRLSVKDPPANATYTWSNGASTASINPGSIGTYTVTVTDAENCVMTATAQVRSATDCKNLRAFFENNGFTALRDLKIEEIPGFKPPIDGKNQSENVNCLAPFTNTNDNVTTADGEPYDLKGYLQQLCVNGVFDEIWITENGRLCGDDNTLKTIQQNLINTTGQRVAWVHLFKCDGESVVYFIDNKRSLSAIQLKFLLINPDIYALNLNDEQINWLIDSETMGMGITTQIKGFLSNNRLKYPSSIHDAVVIHLQMLMTNVDYRELNQQMVSWPGWMWEIVGEILVEVAQAILKKNLPGVNLPENVINAIKSCGTGDLLGCIGNTIDVLKEFFPALRAVDMVIDAGENLVKATKVWKAIEKLQTFGEVLCGNLFKVIKAQSGNLMDNFQWVSDQVGAKLTGVDPTGFFDSFQASFPNAQIIPRNQLASYELAGFYVGDQFGIRVSIKYGGNTNPDGYTLEIKPYRGTPLIKIRFE